MLQKFLQKLKQKRYYATQYKLDHDRFFLFEIIGNFLTSKYFAAIIAGIFSLFFKIFVYCKKSYIVISKSFSSRLVVFFTSTIIILLFLSIIGVSSYKYIVNNGTTSLFPQSSRTQLEITFNFQNSKSEEEKNNLPNNETKSEYAQNVEAIIKSQITELLKNNFPDKNYNINDLTFSIYNNDQVAVRGNPDIIQAVRQVEQKFAPNQGSDSIITLTDQYGRPLIYGQNINTSTGKFNTNTMANLSYTINSKDRDGGPTSVSGQSLYEISGSGKWWGKQLTGQIFKSSSTRASSYSKFTNISFTLSDDGFFTAFTKYLYIMQADYQYRWQTIGSTSGKTKPINSANFNNDYRFQPNITDDSTTNTKYWENQYIGSFIHHFQILIWVNQNKIFSSTAHLSQNYSGGNQDIEYSFNWNRNTTVGENFYQEAKLYIDMINKSRGGSAGLDHNNDPWYLQNNSKNGYSITDDMPVNFLDFGFNHRTKFKLNPDSKNTDSAPQDDFYKENRSQSWAVSIQKPYKTSTSGSDLYGGDPTNPNYNVLHFFTLNNKFFSLGYGENIPINNKPTAASGSDNMVTLGYPYTYSYFVNSPYGIVGNPANEQTTIDNVISNATNLSGLLSVLDVTSSSDNESGLTEVTYANVASSDKSVQYKSISFYKTGNWGDFIPNLTKDPDANQPNPEKRTFAIGSYYNYIISSDLASNFTYSQSLYVLPSTDTGVILEILILITIAISVILLFIFLISYYRVFGLIISSFLIMYLLSFGVIIRNAQLQLNPASMSVIVFGIFVFIVAIFMSITEFRKNFIAYRNKVEDRRIFNKRQFFNFFNVFFIIFLSSTLITVATAQNILNQSALLIAIMLVVVFILINFLLRYLILTFLINEKLDNVSIKLFQFDKKQSAEFENENKLISKYGLITDNIQNKKRDILIQQYESEFYHDSQNSNTKKSMIKKHKNNIKSYLFGKKQYLHGMTIFKYMFVKLSKFIKRIHNHSKVNKISFFGGFKHRSKKDVIKDNKKLKKLSFQKSLSKKPDTTKINEKETNVKQISKNNGLSKSLKNFFFIRNVHKSEFETKKLFKNEIPFKLVKNTYGDTHYTSRHEVLKGNIGRLILPACVIILFLLSALGIALNFTHEYSKIVRFGSQKETQTTITITPNVNTIIDKGHELGFVKLNSDDPNNRYFETNWSYDGGEFWTGISKDFNYIENQMEKYCNKNSIIYKDPQSQRATVNQGLLLSKGISLTNVNVYNHNVDNRFDNYLVTDNTNNSGIVISVPSIVFNVDLYFQSYSNYSPKFINLKNEFMNNIIKNYSANSTFFQDYNVLGNISEDQEATTTGLIYNFTDVKKTNVIEYLKGLGFSLLFMLAILLIFIFFRHTYQTSIVFILGVIFYTLLAFSILALVFPVNLYIFTIFIIGFILIIFNMLYFFNQAKPLLSNYINSAPYKYARKQDIKLIAFNAIKKMHKILMYEFWTIFIFSSIWILFFLFPKIITLLHILNPNSDSHIVKNIVVKWSEIIHFSNFGDWWQYGVLLVIILIGLLIFFTTTFIYMWISINYYFVNRNINNKINSINNQEGISENTVKGINNPKEDISIKQVLDINPEIKSKFIIKDKNSDE